MFHEAAPHLRAWLARSARARPEARAQLERDLARLRAAHEASESDRAARLSVIHDMQRGLDEHFASVDRLRQELEASERDRQARLALIGQLESLLVERDADNAARLAQIEKLERAVAELQDEAASWLRILPGVRLRVPGGRRRADWFRDRFRPHRKR